MLVVTEVYHDNKDDDLVPQSIIFPLGSVDIIPSHLKGLSTN